MWDFVGLLCGCAHQFVQLSLSPCNDNSINNFFVPFSKGCLWGGLRVWTHTTSHIIFCGPPCPPVHKRVCLNITKGRPQEEASPFLEYY